MSDLERALDEFRSEMLAKFSAPKVLAKRGVDSVTIDGNLDKMEERAIWRHYQEEIEERFAAQYEGPARRASEDVDVANMAFLSWYSNRRKP